MAEEYELKKTVTLAKDQTRPPNPYRVNTPEGTQSALRDALSMAFEQGQMSLVDLNWQRIAPDGK